jgi:hypothetical protein
MFFGTLWGMLIFDMGVLLLLLSNWVAPIIDQYPAAVESLQQGGSVYRVSDEVSAILLMVGTVILAVVAIVFVKDTTAEGR